MGAAWVWHEPRHQARARTGLTNGATELRRPVVRRCAGGSTRRRPVSGKWQEDRLGSAGERSRGVTEAEGGGGAPEEAELWRRRAMEAELWRRSYGGGAMEAELWRRSCGGGAVEAQ
jgi:hypothetical protein